MHVSTRDEALFPCGVSRGTPRFMSTLERKPQGPATSLDEDLVPGPTGEVCQDAPPNSHGNWPFLRPHERVPEVPVLT